VRRQDERRDGGGDSREEAQDSPQFLPPCSSTTAQNFTVREVPCDKGYSSIENVKIGAMGATPFIPYKPTHTGKGGGLWERMFHYFNFRRDEFLPTTTSAATPKRCSAWSRPSSAMPSAASRTWR
jgi:hypothetical protein